MIDIGANLTNRAFAGDLDAVLARARAAGVSRIVVTGTDLQNSARAIELVAGDRAYLSATAGIHPHAAAAAPPDWRRQLQAIGRRDGIVAIGETGLDFNRLYSPVADQEALFRGQLELAAELGLPVFVHDRDSGGRVGAMIAALRARLTRVVVHCFTGSAADLAVHQANDCYIGITGWVCDERRGEQLAALVPQVARERLLLETDAPYLLPRTLAGAPRNRRNEPAFLGAVAARIAELRGETVDDVIACTTANARRFFALD